MSNENDRYVVHNPEGGWDVRAGDAERASGHFQTQTEAYKRARQIVANLGGGEVRIQGRDGRFRNSNTIGKPDPNPPRDTKH
jgi:hypothetical protein